MFPIRDPRGKVIAFGGRALKADAQAKYLNSPETPLFHKGAVLYNHDKARGAAHELGAIIAVEGYIDVIAMHQAGFPNAVAPLGTARLKTSLRCCGRLRQNRRFVLMATAPGSRQPTGADLALPPFEAGYSIVCAYCRRGAGPG
jgi:DNA primase